MFTWKMPNQTCLRSSMPPTHKTRTLQSATLILLIRCQQQASSAVRVYSTLYILISYWRVGNIFLKTTIAKEERLREELLWLSGSAEDAHYFGLVLFIYFPMVFIPSIRPRLSSFQPPRWAEIRPSSDTTTNASKFDEGWFHHVWVHFDIAD